MPLGKSKMTMEKYIAIVRVKIRDYPELNRLEKFEKAINSDAMIAMAIETGLEKFNGTPPSTNVTVETFPRKYLLVDLALLELLISEGLFYTKNSLSYQDARVMISDKEGKDNSTMMWIKQFMQTTILSTREFKKEQNLRGAFGGISSGYAR